MKSSLPDIQKFNYLKSLLAGDAYYTIDGFALTNPNYKEAVNFTTVWFLMGYQYIVKVLLK